MLLVDGVGEVVDVVVGVGAVSVCEGGGVVDDGIAGVRAVFSGIVGFVVCVVGGVVVVDGGGVVDVAGFAGMLLIVTYVVYGSEIVHAGGVDGVGVLGMLVCMMV